MEKCDGLVHPAAAKPREGCGRQDAGCRHGPQQRKRGAGIRQDKEVNTLLNLNNKKTRKILSTVVIVIVVLAMVLPMVLGSLLSII